MIESFVLQNLTTNERASFGVYEDADYIYKPGGIDWGNALATHNTYSYPGQVGVSISSTKINERDVYMQAYVYYIMSKRELLDVPRSEWLAYGYEKIKAKKKKLNDLINPNDYVRLTVGDYYIDGKPSFTPHYGKDDSENNKYFCKFLVNIYCANPMFNKNTYTSERIENVIPEFHFPLILKNTGVVMSKRYNYNIIPIANEGNVPVGGKIYFEANGEIVNPVVENINTGESIRINKTMQNGDKILVNTISGEERGIYGIDKGQKTDFLQYWDWNNTWFQFEKGTTLIGFSTENGADSLLDISVEINPQKYGLEEM